MLVIVALGVGAAVAGLGGSGATREVAPVATAAVTAAPADGVVVHVLGAVAHPGLYRFAADARVVDAVAAAGGFTADADQGGVNLARALVDGEQLAVPKQGEAPASAAPGAPGGLVNLNTADATLLQTLPRIGPAMAQRIIDWREQNGGFQSVDDLRSVSGVGEVTFADLEPLVTV